MILTELLKGVRVLEIKGNTNIDIKSLSQKIENVEEGSLFFCFKGVNNDGHNFVDKAISLGAVALVVERFVPSPLPQVLVRKTRNIMTKICENFFSGTTKKLKLIGITGTNGKTTTSHIIHNVLKSSGYKAGVIGTNGAKFGKTFVPLTLTTPDTIELYYLFNKMQKQGIEYVIMEVSAHALALNKIKGLKFEVGIFTNLTQDHLDYFKTMHSYAKTKLKFLNKNYCKHIVLNVDDNYGNIFRKLVNTKLTTFGLTTPASCFAINVNLTLEKTEFVANVFDEVLFINSSLPCLFNVYNLLGAIICCKILGVNSKDIVSSIKNFAFIDGRMNRYKLSNGAIAIIDFAHTPDGLEKVLQNLVEIKGNGKLTCVFGCGGNRDKTKRVKMGEVADKYCEQIILTNDNPRNESPQKIVNEISKGIKVKPYKICLDRKQAIIDAINSCQLQDVILIAGKGAENYQEINGKKKKYNDKDVLLKYLYTDNK